MSQSGPQPLTAGGIGGVGGGFGGARSGTHGGTIGTPPDGPLLDGDVPILFSLFDCCLDRRRHARRLVPRFKDTFRPWLIDDFRHNVCPDLRGRPPLREESGQAGTPAGDRLPPPPCHEYRRHAPLRFPPCAIEKAIHDHGNFRSGQLRQVLFRVSAMSGCSRRALSSSAASEESRSRGVIMGACSRLTLSNRPTQRATYEHRA
jgi:hypothetical protein